MAATPALETPSSEAVSADVPTPEPSVDGALAPSVSEPSPARVEQDNVALLSASSQAATDAATLGSEELLGTNVGSEAECATPREDSEADSEARRVAGGATLSSASDAQPSQNLLPTSAPLGVPHDVPAASSTTALGDASTSAQAPDAVMASSGAADDVSGAGDALAVETASTVSQERSPRLSAHTAPIHATSDDVPFDSLISSDGTDDCSAGPQLAGMDVSAPNAVAAGSLGTSGPSSHVEAPSLPSFTQPATDHNSINPVVEYQPCLPTAEPYLPAAEPVSTPILPTADVVGDSSRPVAFPATSEDVAVAPPSAVPASAQDSLNGVAQATLVPSASTSVVASPVATAVVTSQGVDLPEGHADGGCSSHDPAAPRGTNSDVAGPTQDTDSNATNVASHFAQPGNAVRQSDEAVDIAGANHATSMSTAQPSNRALQSGEGSASAAAAAGCAPVAAATCPPGEASSAHETACQASSSSFSPPDRGIAADTTTALPTDSVAVESASSAKNAECAIGTEVAQPDARAVVGQAVTACTQIEKGEAAGAAKPPAQPTGKRKSRLREREWQSDDEGSDGSSEDEADAEKQAKTDDRHKWDGNAPEVVEQRSPMGRFCRFNRILGRGAHKVVYLGYDGDTGKEVAWNTISLREMDKKSKRRITEEINMLKALKHPRIIGFINAWQCKQENQVCFITERVTGGSLNTYIKRLNAPLKIRVMRTWCRQILEGVNHLHTRAEPIIHRDLKCDNIFINGSVGEVLIGDLGLSTTLTTNAGFATSIVGTPDFIAPEIYQEKYDTKVDIYAYGMCMLEMVTFGSPFPECATAAQVYKKVVAGGKPRVLKRFRDEDLRVLVDGCIDLNPENRPSAAELLDHQWLQDNEADANKLVDLIPESELPLSEVGHLARIAEEEASVSIAASSTAGAFAASSSMLEMTSAATTVTVAAGNTSNAAAPSQPVAAALVEAQHHPDGQAADSASHSSTAVAGAAAHGGSAAGTPSDSRRSSATTVTQTPELAAIAPADPEVQSLQPLEAAVADPQASADPPGSSAAHIASQSALTPEPAAIVTPQVAMAQTEGSQREVLVSAGTVPTTASESANVAAVEAGQPGDPVSANDVSSTAACSQADSRMLIGQAELSHTSSAPTALSAQPASQTSVNADVALEVVTTGIDRARSLPLAPSDGVVGVTGHQEVDCLSQASSTAGGVPTVISAPALMQHNTLAPSQDLDLRPQLDASSFNSVPSQSTLEPYNDFVQNTHCEGVGVPSIGAPMCANGMVDLDVSMTRRQSIGPNNRIDVNDEMDGASGISEQLSNVDNSRKEQDRLRIAGIEKMRKENAVSMVKSLGRSIVTGVVLIVQGKRIQFDFNAEEDTVLLIATALLDEPDLAIDEPIEKLMYLVEDAVRERCHELSRGRSREQDFDKQIVTDAASVGTEEGIAPATEGQVASGQLSAGGDANRGAEAENIKGLWSRLGWAHGVKHPNLSADIVQQRLAMGEAAGLKESITLLQKSLAVLNPDITEESFKQVGAWCDATTSAVNSFIDYHKSSNLKDVVDQKFWELLSFHIKKRESKMEDKLRQREQAEQDKKSRIQSKTKDNDQRMQELYAKSAQAFLSSSDTSGPSAATTAAQAPAQPKTLSPGMA
eukprot:TRINITY_DN29134_c0_g2_i1.p1 TRINITY_DN29134_c0_g2~~TRINITY_DN29134_c0_g2_i1.p1  ORF type:complete len:1633 (-),score=279.03 TRINITY_DN29134_c0_g2_i1:210-5108(-)